MPGERTISGTYHGRDEAVECLTKLAEKSYTSVPEHFLGDDGHVVVLTRTTSDGKPSNQVDVYTFREGKIAQFNCVLDTLLHSKSGVPSKQKASTAALGMSRLPEGWHPVPAAFGCSAECRVSCLRFT